MPWPKKHPDGTTVADRLRLSNEALEKRGGKRLSVRLEAPAFQALERLRKKTGKTATEIVQEALIDAA